MKRSTSADLKPSKTGRGAAQGRAGFLPAPGQLAVLVPWASPQVAVALGEARLCSRLGSGLPGSGRRLSGVVPGEGGVCGLAIRLPGCREPPVSP